MQVIFCQRGQAHSFWRFFFVSSLWPHKEMKGKYPVSYLLAHIFIQILFSRYYCQVKFNLSFLT